MTLRFGNFPSIESTRISRSPQRPSGGLHFMLDSPTHFSFRSPPNIHQTSCPLTELECPRANLFMDLALRKLQYAYASYTFRPAHTNVFFNSNQKIFADGIANVSAYSNLRQGALRMKGEPTCTNAMKALRDMPRRHCT